MTRLAQTPSQTVGPFFSIGLCREPWNELRAREAGAERVRVEGVLVDGVGAPVPDAMLEVWHPTIGFGRAATDEQGAYRFDMDRPPYVNVIVFARGMLVHAFTRLYFSDDLGNARDAVLQSVDPARRGTLIAQRSDRPGSPVYEWTIRLQGDHETVFFDL